MKRFTALLLLVLLAIAPFSASRAYTEHPVEVFIWGKKLDGTNPYYKNGANGEAGTVYPSEPSDWNAHYDPVNGVLTLKNLNVKDSDAKKDSEKTNYGIYAAKGISSSPSETLIIVLEGENTVSTGDNTASKHSFAISLQSPDNTIKGSGKLTAIAGTTQAGNSEGVNISNGVLTMNGGSVTCKGGTSGGGFGSCGMNGSALNVNGGTLICEGGNGSYSYGVLAIGITVSGGTMEGKGGTANDDLDGNSRGMMAENITVNGGSIKGTGGEAKNDSCGVRAGEKITVKSGGYLQGTGGEANGVGNGGSYGISANTGISLEQNATTLAQGYTRALSVAPTLTGSAVASENYDGKNAVTYVPGNNNNYKYFRMPEAIPAAQITVTQDSFPFGQAPENEKITVTSNDAIFNFNASNSFDSATMDGAPLRLGTVGSPGADGSVSNGSIVIHLNKAYLDTLSVGTHTLLVNLAGIFAGKTVRTSITVLPSGDGTGGAGDDVPQTGDSATPMLWLGIALLASAGLFVSAVRRRKRQNG